MRGPNALTTWPWRPRVGYASVPRWLFVFVLVLVVVAFVVLMAVVFGTDDTSKFNTPGP